MNKIIKVILILMFIFLPFVTNAVVNVKGYYRKDGTYVQPHVRSNPNGLKYDNYGWTPSQWLYNDTYGTRDAEWDTPTGITDPDYYTGKIIYENNQNSTVNVSSTIDNSLSNRLKGKIVLQVENKGQAWYVDTKEGKRHYMADGNEAYRIMRELGVGITNSDLEKVRNDINFAKNHSGKIFLQVEDLGQAFYIDFDGQAHYLKDGNEAYNIMRDLGLGITDGDLLKIENFDFNVATETKQCVDSSNSSN